ncbi:MAG: PTS sugar transporter subunit IIC [Candidatus Latescibacterota bacterium]|nr:MAG: PTS sugar transporter subunit IIC [Candidatus Latescibacterota bacterium]
MNPIAGTDIALLAVLGALLALDQDAGLGLQLSQPLVAGALAGLLLGRFEAGVAGGALIQMIWIVTQPVGGARIPDLALGGVCAVAALPSGATLGTWLQNDELAVAGVLGVLAAFGGGALLRLQRRIQSRLASRATKGALRGETGAVAALQRDAIVLHLLRGGASTALVAVLAPVAAAWALELGLRLPVGGAGLGLASVALLRATPRLRLPWLLLGALLGVVLGVA